MRRGAWIEKDRPSVGGSPIVEPLTREFLSSAGQTPFGAAMGATRKAGCAIRSIQACLGPPFYCQREFWKAHIRRLNMQVHTRDERAFAAASPQHCFG